MNNVVKISKARPNKQFRIHTAKDGKPACNHGAENLAWQETTELVTCIACQKLASKKHDDQATLTDSTVCIPAAG